MKRLIFPLLSLLMISLACQLASMGGSGGQVNNLLPDPLVGLANLDDYRADLVISFTNSADGQTTVDTYSQSKWPSLDSKFTTIDTTDDTSQPLFIVAGNVGDAHYDQIGHDVPCGVWWGETAKVSGGSEFNVTSLLDPIGAAKLVGEETVEGISTKHYTFDGASVGLPDDVKASGDVWLATEGGYVVKYSLQITGGESYFGEGKQGTRQTDYLLSEVNANPQVVYPYGCEPVLTDVPALEDAAEIIRLPGMLDYFSNSSLDEITVFYTDFFESQGWVKASDIRPEGGQAFSIFIRSEPEEVAFVSARPEDGTMSVNVSIVEQGAAAAPEAGATPGNASSPALRVASGLGILLGLDDDQQGLPSYHMEATHQVPVWNNGAVAQYNDLMSADAQGVDVHFIDRSTDPSGTTTVSEAYVIEGQEYVIKNGAATPGSGMTELVWTLWPLDPVTVLGTGATAAQLTGTETIDGRMAEVYDIAATGPLSAPGGMGLAVTAVNGQVWIDQETGALLKAVLDYQADVKDADGNTKGNGPGHLEILVSQVGSTSVALP